MVTVNLSQSRRPDPTRCGSLRHDWLPVNISKDGRCKPCKRERAAGSTWVRPSRGRGVGRSGVRGPRGSTIAVFEDFEDMKDTGETFEGCMRRLGMQPATFMKLVSRWPDHAPRLHAEGVHW